MGFFRKSSAQSDSHSQESTTQQMQKRFEQALAQSTRTKERADELGEQINQIADRLAEKGVNVDSLKWCVKARFRYAHTGVEAAHQEAHKAEQKLSRIRERMNQQSGFSDRQYVDRLTEAAETIAAKSEAYLQAVQAALDLWTDLERQTKS